MFKKLILILTIATISLCRTTAQNNQNAHLLTQSCTIATDGKLVINAGGHYTTSATEQLQLADSLHSSTYDTVGNVFKNNKRLFYSYDSGGLMTESISKIIDKSGTTWSEGQLTAYKYTGFQLYEETFKSWDKTLPAWVDFQKNKYSYSTDNSLVTIFYLPWDSDSSEFRYSTKDLINYNPNQTVSSITNQKFNKNLGSWDNYLQINFMYSGGYVSQKLYQVYNKTTSLWEDYQKETFTYSNNNKTEVVIQVKSATTAWENYSRTVFAYVNSSLDNSTDYLWYGAWTNKMKSLYTYNAANLITKVITQQWSAFTGAFRNQAQDESYYSQHEVIGISESKADVFIVNNPLSKHTAFQLSGLKENTSYQMKLISVNGTVVMSMTVNAGQTVQLNNQLSNGIYIMNLTASGIKTLNQKILLTD